LEEWQVKKREELNAFCTAKQQSQLLSEDQRTQFLKPFMDRWLNFLKTHFEHSTTTVVTIAPGAQVSSSNGQPGTRRQPEQCKSIHAGCKNSWQTHVGGIRHRHASGH
jgi:hypothetical protein